MQRYCLVCVILIILTQPKKNKELKRRIEKLERERNRRAKPDGLEKAIEEGNISMCVRREYIWGMVGCLAIADIFIRVMVWVISNEAWGVLRCVSALLYFASVSVLVLVAYVVLHEILSKLIQLVLARKKKEKRLKENLNN